MGDLVKKPKAPSFQIGSGWTLVVLQVNTATRRTQRLMESEFRFDVTHLQIAAMMSFHAEKCCHLVSAHAAFARRICSSVRTCKWSVNQWIAVDLNMWNSWPVSSELTMRIIRANFYKGAESSLLEKHFDSTRKNYCSSKLTKIINELKLFTL